MHRNIIHKDSILTELSSFILNLKTQSEVENFLSEILTQKEISTLTKRWRILKLLSQGISQRKIATSLKVGLCKVTRGAKIFKTKNSIIAQNINKENTNANVIN